MATSSVKTTCCVVGGGPAGMMLGYLLARAGINVTVLEKHNDFLRDFRGDTVHPSTMEVMHELGILKEFLKRPHQELERFGGVIEGETIQFADLRHIHAHCKFIAFMPQWEFLDFISQQAKRFPSFDLRMNTEAFEVIEDANGRITGVKVRSKDGGEYNIEADLTVAADGRTSILREKAGFQVEDLGAPMDVLWMRLSRKPTDQGEVLGRLTAGLVFVMLNRGDYWQCAYVIDKGKAEELKERGLDEFKKRIVGVAPFLADRVDELTSWDQVKLLTVRVDRLEKWYREGMLCIGDAAHAMSPIGGVGINLAIQDAVATANILWKPLAEGKCTTADLQKVQDRRMYPTRMTQRVQLNLQNSVIKGTLSSDKPLKPPLILQAFNWIPALRTIPATIVGIGFRPEHVHVPLRQATKVGSAAGS